MTVTADTWGSEAPPLVVGAPGTPTAVLVELAGHADPSVREQVATHPNTPVRTLERLGGDEEPAVRALVASNPNTPLVAIAALSGDKEPDVRRAAVATLAGQWSVVGAFQHLPLDR